MTAAWTASVQAMARSSPCGSPLNSRDFRLHDGQVIAELAEPFPVGGEMLPAGASILLDLPTGDVVPRR
jgi:hypothetical protein